MKRLFALAMVAGLAVPMMAADGAALFTTKCAGCHGADGTKAMPAMGVKPINTSDVKGKGADTLKKEISNGVGKMPGFAGKLTPEEITAVTEYVLALK
jgi:cytochrome c6